MGTLGWKKHKLESRLPGEISITSHMQTTPHLWQSEEELKRLLMKVQEESENVGLKLNIQKTKIMASGLITSCQKMRKQWKQWQTLFWGGSKITADGDCSHEIKRCLLLGRKVMTNLYQFSSVTQSCQTLCASMDCSTPGLPVHHQLPELT